MIHTLIAVEGQCNNIQGKPQQVSLTVAAASAVSAQNEYAALVNGTCQ